MSKKENIINISDKKIGEGYPCFIIAELSANHLNDLSLTLETVNAAKEAGADAFKIQTLTADTMTIDCDNKYFTITGGTAWDGRTLYDLYSETPFPYEWHQAVFDECAKLNLLCFSTPYDKTSVDFLDRFNMPAYKIASFEIMDIPLIRYVARKKKPIIMSTGVASQQDINDAVDACRLEGNDDIVLLKCTSAYPAPYDEINLRSMRGLSEKYNVVVGLSDHTMGIEVPIASVALDGHIIEKHLTMSRSNGGPDSGFSLEPDEFASMVQAVRNTEQALGDGYYELTASSKKSMVFSRSLFFVKDIKRGEVISEEHLRSIRPGYGLKPKYLEQVIGAIAAEDISRGTPCHWKHIIRNNEKT